MKEAFVLNSEASRSDLVYDLHGQLDELRWSLDAMSTAAHDEGQPEGAYLACIRQVQCIQQLAEEVTTDKAEDAKRAEAEIERIRQETYVKPYFDPKTDDAKRAQLEEFIIDDDIAAELSQIKHGKKSWAHMVKQDETRLKLIDELKAKRARVNGEAAP